ncbi:glycosyltransferase family 2 protein [Mesobacillus sp. AQ2]|uniref:glycosyltransferase family 2 protein n=1 Tax=Mesobacillus sp. AQ2 TaxID=3043332 RepID=UPI0024C15693|nr:glycosyltransferase family 2 protein [Mesobacillus sp. AQ2]WHX41426.1 glycosyltransferase family 2 protein [Mesobacillus sp. AQ2]
MPDKVSVVVPIYRVEKYLNRCIDSILNQTYRNIEIILVNDGSPDRCGSIAEEYAANDSRIKVIHKENGGLSDARNAGMEKVTSKYMIFVDSDDWLAANAIDILLSTSKKYKADVVQSAFYYAYEDHLLIDRKHYNAKRPPVILNTESLMYELVKNERVKNFAWGKLYKTSILQDIPFKKGVLFEDVFWAHQVMDRVQKFILINQPLYFYMQRSDSIVASYTPRNLDILAGLKERHKFIEENYQDLVDESYKGILKNSLIHYNLLILNWRKNKSGLYRKEIRDYIRKNSAELKNAVAQDKTLKTELTMFLLHPILNILFTAVKKVFRQLEIISEPSGFQMVPLNKKNTQPEKLLKI